MRFLVSLWNGGPLSVHRAEKRAWADAIELADHFMESSLWAGDLTAIELEENGILLRRWVLDDDGEWVLA